MTDQEKEEARRVIGKFDGALCAVNVAMLDLKKANKEAQEFYSKIGKK